MSTEFESNFVIDISLNKKNQVQIYFKEQVSIFMNSLGVSEYEILEPKEQISSSDFKSVDFEYFYLKVMSGINKSDKHLMFPRKVAITFDKRVCKQYNHKAQRYYETLKIGGVETLYFILFSIDEVYDCL
ncbi:hypothetical protein [Psychrobacter sanguinis]|uniref:hypothetical protein n=1 Tax=Psychrobacter sanguinis TaxID=861445 RepID=UPI002A7498CF|nr:hypothetical protein [Psychrobacter sanguinis]MDY3306052.1 hypothetical protein [Psychrobacter sanguinis]